MHGHTPTAGRRARGISRLRSEAAIPAGQTAICRHREARRTRHCAGGARGVLDAPQVIWQLEAQRTVLPSAKFRLVGRWGD